MTNPSERRSHGKFFLSTDDVASFLSGAESARAISMRKGVSGSLVAYHLKKRNDPAINAMLARNTTQSRCKMEAEKRAKIDAMVLAGRPVAEIMDVLRTSAESVIKSRKRLGLYAPPDKPKKKATSTKPGTVYDLLANVVDTAVFKVLTGKWPVDLEQTTMEQAA